VEAAPDQVRSSGRVVTPPAAAEQAGLPEGLYVQTVAAGGPAAWAGLRAGDVITKVDGEAATSNIQLQELTLTKSPVTRCPAATPGMATRPR
jgi:S1-C subfamily serine protease